MPHEIYEPKLPLNRIFPSELNTRTSFPEASMRELRDSIIENGLQQPIVVRKMQKLPDSNLDDMYEIVCGERRFRAVKEIPGADSISAFIRELGDAEVIAIQLIENLQREGLSPIEEAEGYAQAIRKCGYSAEQLAAKIGKSRTYVYNRLKLLDLCDQGRELLQNGTLQPTVAMAIARIPGKALQERALEQCKEDIEDGAPVRETKEWLDRNFTCDLKEAAWPMDWDAAIKTPECTLPLCTVCTHRSGNAREVFPDIEDDNICTNLDCYNLKKGLCLDEMIQMELAADHTVITGEKAEKLCPYADSNYMIGHVKVSTRIIHGARFPDDLTFKRLMEMAADGHHDIPTCKPIFVAHANSGRLFEVITNDDANELRKAAYRIFPDQHEEEKTEKIIAEKSEYQVREELRETWNKVWETIYYDHLRPRIRWQMDLISEAELLYIKTVCYRIYNRILNDIVIDAIKSRTGIDDKTTLQSWIAEHANRHDEIRGIIFDACVLDESLMSYVPYGATEDSFKTPSDILVRLAESVGYGGRILESLISDVSRAILNPDAAEATQEPEEETPVAEEETPKKKTRKKAVKT